MELFDLNTDYDLVRKVRFETIIKPLGPKKEQRISKTPDPEDGAHTFRIVLKNRLISDLAVKLYTFYKARRGSFEKFEVVDPLSTAAPPANRKIVRFAEDELEERMFIHLLESSELEVVEVE